MKKKQQINLFGISGKSGSGKDTVGNIISWLIFEDKYQMKMQTNYSKTFCSKSDWQNKKFAGKVKEILSILTGIPVEDFEKEEVKNSYLGEEWNRWKLEWYVDSPKSWVDMRTTLHGSKKKALSKIGLSEIHHRKDIYPHKISEERITIRMALQLIGTDLFRDKFHENTFSIALFADYVSNIPNNILKMPIKKAKKKGILNLD